MYLAYYLPFYNYKTNVIIISTYKKISSKDMEYLWRPKTFKRIGIYIHSAPHFSNMIISYNSVTIINNIFI